MPLLNPNLLMELKAHWKKFENELGGLSEQLVSLTKKYVNSLSGNIRDRFPEPELLSAFACFDPNYLPLRRDERESYGFDQIKELVER